MSLNSVDIVSEFDKAEMNNAFDQTQREITSRYDFKNTPAQLEWMPDKKGVTITGDSQFQIDAIVEILRKKMAGRNLQQKILDTSAEPVNSNLKMTWNISFKEGLDQDKAKKINKIIRDEIPKVKTQIQGDAVRVMSKSKDELQAVIQLINKSELDFPVSFNNYR
jgi:uncharacterized protein YajQ (UPF0234 family)